MTSRIFVGLRRTRAAAMAWFFLLLVLQQPAGSYTLGTTVADMRQAASRSGGTSCPQLTRFDVSAPGAVALQWDTVLGNNPATILTADQTPSGQLAEIEGVIQQAMGVWSGVSGTTLTPAAFAPLARTSLSSGCNSSDGFDTICFDQNDAAFAPGVLAFTRVVSADAIGEQIAPGSPPSTFIGQILDADILVRPGDSNSTFATPAALPSYPNSYDLESILTHELGHVLGFDHSAVWSAMMFPFAPPPGQITGVRPTPQSPDAPLSDDDRTGLRELYPDSNDVVHVGSIHGRILRASPLELPVSPPGVTGIFPANVVAVDDATGAIVAATMAGWSCAHPGPPQFDGSYAFERLPVGATQSYQIYVEPLDGAVMLGNILQTTTAICRNALSDPGWPLQFACTVPPPAAPFSARIRPGP